MKHTPPVVGSALADVEQNLRTGNYRGLVTQSVGHSVIPEQHLTTDREPPID